MYILFCVVFYLKATFGPGTGDALLEIPVSVTGSNKYLIFDYQISSPKIELGVLQSKAGNTEISKMRTYTDEYNAGGWSRLKFPLNSEVEAILLVARKTGVTTNVEYVFVDRIEIISDRDTGKICIPLVYYYYRYVIGKVYIVLALRCCKV